MANLAENELADPDAAIQVIGEEPDTERDGEMAASPDQSSWTPGDIDDVPNCQMIINVDTVLPTQRSANARSAPPIGQIPEDGAANDIVRPVEFPNAPSPRIAVHSPFLSGAVIRRH